MTTSAGIVNNHERHKVSKTTKSAEPRSTIQPLGGKPAPGLQRTMQFQAANPIAASTFAWLYLRQAGVLSIKPANRAKPAVADKGNSLPAFLPNNSDVKHPARELLPLLYWTCTTLLDL